MEPSDVFVTIYLEPSASLICICVVGRDGFTDTCDALVLSTARLAEVCKNKIQRIKNVTHYISGARHERNNPSDSGTKQKGV